MTLWICDCKMGEVTLPIHVSLDEEDFEEAEKVIVSLGLGLKLVGKLLEETPANIPNI